MDKGIYGRRTFAGGIKEAISVSVLVNPSNNQRDQVGKNVDNKK